MCLKQSVLYSWNVPHSPDHMKSMCSRPLTNPFTIRTQTCTLNIRKKDKKEKMTARQTDWVGKNICTVISGCLLVSSMKLVGIGKPEQSIHTAPSFKGTTSVPECTKQGLVGNEV